MEHLNDIGISLEILGFVIFLFIPIRETFNLLINPDEKKLWEKLTMKLDNNKVRGFGIGLIFFWFGTTVQLDS